MGKDTRPLVMHVLHRFDTGGLENGVVNLVNHMPPGAYRHMIVALTEVTAFRQRLVHADVECVALHKPPGHGMRVYPRFAALLHRHRPAVVHTRNLAALEMQVPAWLWRVPARIHGEHGRDADDVDGSNRRLQRVRRLYAPFVQRYVALSADLQRYLEHAVGIAPARVTQIYNGVDVDKFKPAASTAPIHGCEFSAPSHWILGTIGRLQKVKNQPLLAQAFVRALELAPALRTRLRLAIVGEGALRAATEEQLASAGLRNLAWLPGERSDVADVMRGLSCFALPSLAEGVSNTILEAMASGLPVVATDVGGNAELVADGLTGLIVPTSDVDAMAKALIELATDPARAAEMGRQGRVVAQRRFSLQAMVSAYQRLYDSQLAAAGHTRRDN